MMLDRQAPQSRSDEPLAPEKPSVPARLRAMVRRAVFRARLVIIRRFSSSLTRRIAFLNLAGLVALFLGFLWLNQTRLGVIDARSQSLSLQAELIAGAIAGALPIEADPLELDPDKLLQQQLLENQSREEQRAPGSSSRSTRRGPPRF